MAYLQLVWAALLPWKPVRCMNVTSNRRPKNVAIPCVDKAGHSAQWAPSGRKQ